MRKARHHLPQQARVALHKVEKERLQEEAAARYGVLQGRAQGGSAASEPPPRANFCRKCLEWKPARAHHCSVCGCCILKLDHYCLWIVNAVGLLNQKFFLLFLFYCTLACTEAAAVMIPAAVQLLRTGNVNGPKPGLFLFAAVFCFAFAIALVMFLSIHWDMLAKNYTSVESLDRDAVAMWPHDRGLYRNFVEVFGRRCALPLCRCSAVLARSCFWSM